MSHLITKLCKEENREKTSEEGGRNKENKEQELGRRGGGGGEERATRCKQGRRKDKRYRTEGGRSAWRRRKERLKRERASLQG